jgi:hypothetical protein
VPTRYDQSSTHSVNRPLGHGSRTSVGRNSLTIGYFPSATLRPRPWQLPVMSQFDNRYPVFPVSYLPDDASLASVCIRIVDRKCIVGLVSALCL